MAGRSESSSAHAKAAKPNLLHGCPSELFFWRSRAQSEVDLVVQTGDQLGAFEIEWQPRHIATRAFTGMYRVEVELVSLQDFLTSPLWTMWK